MPSWTTLKEATQFVQSLLTAFAILAAGVWFLMQGESRPRLTTEHRVSSRFVAGDPSRRLVSVDVFLSNAGRVPIDLNCGQLKIFDINPGSPAPLWKPDNDCLPFQRLEPGEGDQIHQEFVVPAATATVRVHSFFPNPKYPERDFGWDYVSVYDLVASSSNPKPASSQPGAREN